ncbi:H-type small acid-soluble spore protein [Amphibacillus sp. Q70]|uniref:H-type small acid-soluble spore protein n=1 Tax=Amphibacillus sp. Q70 TaxID=3453416 RepID=UPI003F87ABA8
MNPERAQEIVMIPDMINVTFENEKVYIEHVDQDQKLATIHPLDNPEKKISVPVNKLVEH